MEWSDYHLILAITRERSVRGAARKLGVSHATVSRRLAQLNRGPDGPLVQKSPSGLWPSKAGKAIVEAAEKMETVAAEATRRRRAAETRLAGPLSISIPVLVLHYLLFDDVIAFTEQYPNIDLTIDSSDVLVDLDRAEADIVIRNSASPPDHWVGRRLEPYCLSFYAHKDYLASTPPDQLIWIAPSRDETRWRDWKTGSPYPDAEIGLTITDISGRFEAIKRGLGLGRAACFMADPDLDLVRLPDAPIVEAEPFWFLSHPDLANTARVQAAVKFFAEALQAKQALYRGGL
ncbi:MAG: LysR family transcriptional regulator [Pseudomonadota bacterium]